MRYAEDSVPTSPLRLNTPRQPVEPNLEMLTLRWHRQWTTQRASRLGGVAAPLHRQTASDSKVREHPPFRR